MRIVTTEPVGDNALTVYYKTADGKLLERMLFRLTKPNCRWLKLAVPGPLMHAAVNSSLRSRPTASTLRIFDPMMAVHTSNVEPLPHQITAVYESLLLAPAAALCAGG